MQGNPLLAPALSLWHLSLIIIILCKGQRCPQGKAILHAGESDIVPRGKRYCMQGKAILYVGESDVCRGKRYCT